MSTISCSEDVRAIIERVDGDKIVINCADHPSVDDTPHWINEACQISKVPYIISGGYNLHLSLIGMTVIPGISACYQCSRITLDEMQSEDFADLKRLDRPWRNIGNLGPLVAITSSFTANEALRLSLKSEELMPIMLNRRGEYNFLTNRINFVDLPQRRECACCVRL